jgi:cation diffusion facilitator CzcD-associated flavoprotein CzcO
VIDANGDEHDLDIVVLATGFDAANYLANYKVHGLRGVEIHDTWKGEPEAFLGIMVPDYPNFFMMYGPNTNSVPLPAFYEAQAAFAASLLTRMRNKGCSRVEVRRTAMVAFNEWLQSRLRRTVWSTTTSYFTAGTGRVVSQWPFGATPYMLATRLLRNIAVRIS